MVTPARITAVGAQPAVASDVDRQCIDSLRTDRGAECMPVLVGDDAHARSDQGVVADIDAPRAIDDAEVIDFDTVAQAHASIAALNIGKPVQRDLVAEAHSGAARGIHRCISVDLAPGAEADVFRGLDVGGKGNAIAGTALPEDEQQVFDGIHVRPPMDAFPAMPTARRSCRTNADCPCLGGLPAIVRQWRHHRARVRAF